VEVETEQVVLHNNFADRVAQMLKENPEGRFGYYNFLNLSVSIQGAEDISEITVLEPAHKEGYPVRALLRAYNLPTIRELSEWMRKHTNEVRMKGEPIPTESPLFPDKN
jgi:hypothetical protein